MFDKLLVLGLTAFSTYNHIFKWFRRCFILKR